MKHGIILFIVYTLLFGYAISAFSQEIPERKLANIYGGPAIGVGTEGVTVGGRFTLVHANHWGGSIHGRAGIIIINAPSDYDPGSGGILDLDLPEDKWEYLILFSGHVIREFGTSNKRIRFGIEAGPSVVFKEDVEFVPADPGDWGFRANYVVNRESNFSPGLSLRVKLRFNRFRFFGFEIAGLYNYNSYRPFGGVEAQFNFGRVR